MARSYLQTVNDQSQVAEARRLAAMVAQPCQLSEEVAGSLAIVVTELATNLIRHAGGGQLLLRQLSVRAGERPLGVEVLSIDKGPGMANVQECLRDGYSTSSTPGNGLGAVRRLSRVFDVYSKPGIGTVVVAEVWAQTDVRQGHGVRSPSLGVVNVPLAGETECGDSWSVHLGNEKTSVLVIDGLGHGVLAAQAAAEGVKAFDAMPERPAAEQMLVLNGALRPTRGAAGAVAVVDHARGTLGFCGIGNIAGVIVADEGERHMVSHNGTMGHDVRNRSEFAYPWSSDAVLVMASDGIMTRWSMGAYPGLTRRHPALVAGTLFRDFYRGRDDATVVVLRGGASS